RAVRDWLLNRTRAAGAESATLAVDAGSKWFKDRLYAVWADAASGNIDIRFAWSGDKGKTWSAPSRVNDDRPAAVRGHGVDHIMPAVAVNKAGAILVTWFDRRDSGSNMGWRVRGATS